MMKSIDFKKNYIDWLNESIEQHKINNSIYKISLPFLDIHNDYIELYIVETANGLKLTDDSYVLNDLMLCGCDIFSTNRRKAIFNEIINSHGVSCSPSNELFTMTNLSDLPQKKHMLSQCIQKVSDLFYLSQPNIKSLFLEDVQSFLDRNDVRYMPNISLVGKSKLPTNYDFAIPKSKQAPERMIKVVNSLTRDYAKTIIFSWQDTINTRPGDSRLYTFIHDTDRKVSSDALAALSEYSISPIVWSKRDQFASALIA